MAKKVEYRKEDKITALYCRLSVDDIKEEGKKKADESNSIQNQKMILLDYARKNGYRNTMFFVDDGISGTSFERSDFQRMHHMAEEGKIGTIIVKDLSRFGREHIEGDRLAEIIYPTLGITFISIHENINSATGDGMEMLPFYNIFNEWYAAQTSKKVRAVWQSKSDHGERVSSTVAYGYKTDPNNPRHWMIDEPAAKVVRYIFQLCLEGLGVTRIARRLEAERILTPSAYYESVGRKPRKMSQGPYRWADTTVNKILGNMQYTGCTVNFKSTTVSYKVHKTIFNDPEDWTVIPDTQEPIIDPDTWERAQEIKKHRRVNTTTGRKSVLSGLVYCGDCHSKLYFCASKNIRVNQEYFCCSEYKENRGPCTIHFIRNVVLEQLVLKTIREAAAYITEYEPVFLYLFAKQHRLSVAKNRRQARQEIEANKKRIRELDRLFSQAFERNVLGTLDDNRYSRMTAAYEEEQAALMASVAKAEKVLSGAEEDHVDLRNFLSLIRQCTDLQELTPGLVNRLIAKIEVFERYKGEDGKKHIPVTIHFVGAGVIQPPDAKMLREALEEMKYESKSA